MKLILEDSYCVPEVRIQLDDGSHQCFIKIVK